LHCGCSLRGSWAAGECGASIRCQSPKATLLNHPNLGDNYVGSSGESCPDGGDAEAEENESSAHHCGGVR
jgi:hypothetical protein